MDAFRVTLRWPGGPAETVRVRPDESVLAAAEAAGVGLPFGCRTGACATCTGQLCDGAVAAEGPGGGDVAVAHRRRPRALKDRHLAEGYVLCCVAEPRADCAIRVGSAVQGDLVENPWK